MDHDLLTEPLLSWRDAQRHRGKTTLPGLLARLASGELGDFPRLRTHQLHPWCMFLTQLAAIALHRAGKTDPRLPEDEWRDLLLKLTNGAHEPWCLVVDDLSKPAFLQPPVPENSLDDWKQSASNCPDDIDLLATAKNHDVKSSLQSGDDLEAWAYALMTLQTMQGVYGQGKYGISRMKKGYGNRPRVGITTSLAHSAMFRRDVDVMLSTWPALIQRGYRDDGVALTWIAPWDGEGALAMHELAPHFIEVCRRVRCFSHAGGIACRDTRSEGRRCLPEIVTGDVGDPWIPIERETTGALTIGPMGFDYRKLVQVLLETDYAPAAAQRARDDDGDLIHFVAWALARGEGGTEGLHERSLVLAGRVRRQIGQLDARVALGKRAKDRVMRTELMQNKVLLPALRRLALDNRVATEDQQARLREFNAGVDQVFFDRLFSTLDLDDEAARIAWDAELRRLAAEMLEAAVLRGCTASARKYRAIAEAETMFSRCLWRHFRDLMSAESEVGGEPA